MTTPYAQKSGSITTGGVSQLLLQADTLRVGFWVQNLSISDIYIRDFTVATGSGGDIKIPSYALYQSPKDSPVKSQYYIYGPSTGQAFTYKQW